MININVLSLFDGISCGRLALQKNNIHIDSYFASEVDDKAMYITQKNFPDTIQLGDIRNIKGTDLPNVDLLIGGSPCQNLSRANKVNGDGLNGESSKLFWEYVRILEIVKPRYFLFENVGSMTNKDKDMITKTFNVESIMINSALVSAQNRVRYYWTNIPKVKQPEDKFIYLKDILEDNVNERYFLSKDHTYVPSSNSNAISEMKFVCGIISARKWLEDGKNLSRNFPQGNRVYSINGKSCSLNANSGGLGGKTGLYYIENGEDFSKNNIRRLTPIEAERLQTVPDNYTECVSETNRFKLLGNGWTVDVVAHIFKGLK